MVVCTIRFKGSEEMRGLVSALMLSASLVPFSATAQQTPDAFADAAVEASIGLMTVALLCQNVIGDTYIVAARNALELTYRTGGMNQTDAMVATDDAEKALRKKQGSQSALDLVGGDTSGEEVMASCMKSASAAIRQADVANARFLQAVSQ